MREWYEINNAGNVDSPALLIYRQRVSDNIRMAKKISGDVSRLRPHVKTHKIKEVAEMMLEEGISKFKCATIAEAEMLALAGAADILLAYQPTLPKARRFLELARAYPLARFSCLADNSDSAAMLSQVFEGRQLEIYLDLNVGMNRTGVKPGEAPGLYKACLALGNLTVAGLHAYDGHIHDPELAVRKEKAGDVLKLTKKAKSAIEEINGQSLSLVMGGTPTFPVYAEEDAIETSPGTFVFWDKGYRDILPEQPFSFAALLLARVISKIDEHTLCLDLGHKSVAAEGPLQHRVTFLNEPAAEALGQSEEHLVVRVADTQKYQIGDTWYGVPYHICPTVALYDSAHLVEEHIFTKKWKVIARDRMISF